MLLVLSLAFVSLAAVLALTPLTRRLSIRLGVVDFPDSTRKLHVSAIPRTGGIVIVLAYALSAVALAIVARAGWHASSVGKDNLWVVLAPATLVFTVGLIDDVRGVRPWHKLSIELIASALVIACGLRIEAVGNWTLDPISSIVVSLIWLILCTNAFNLIDGVDGLAAGVGLSAAVTFCAFALLQGNMQLAVASAPLVGALAAFLFFNFAPASIFLGDCGSLAIGFLLACFAILWSHAVGTASGFLAPLFVLAIPLLDTVLTIVRRLSRRRPLFAADREHIHHQLLAQGLTPRSVVIGLVVSSSISAALAFFVTLADQKQGIVP